MLKYLIPLIIFNAVCFKNAISQDAGYYKSEISRAETDLKSLEIQKKEVFKKISELRKEEKSISDSNIKLENCKDLLPKTNDGQKKSVSVLPVGDDPCYRGEGVKVTAYSECKCNNVIKLKEGKVKNDIKRNEIFDRIRDLEKKIRLIRNKIAKTHANINSYTYEMNKPKEVEINVDAMLESINETSKNETSENGTSENETSENETSENETSENEIVENESSDKNENLALENESLENVNAENENLENENPENNEIKNSDQEDSEIEFQKRIKNQIEKTSEYTMDEILNLSFIEQRSLLWKVNSKGERWFDYDLYYYLIRYSYSFRINEEERKKWEKVRKELKQKYLAKYGTTNLNYKQILKEVDDLILELNESNLNDEERKKLANDLSKLKSEAIYKLAKKKENKDHEYYNFVGSEKSDKQVIVHGLNNIVQSSQARKKAKDKYFQEKTFIESNSSSDLILKRNNKGWYGFVNANGVWVIKPKFLEARAFKNGKAWVQNKTGKKYYINKSGKKL